jgi:type VI secretion system secreted protein Hcp
MKACATGQHLKEATITHRKAGKGQQEFHRQDERRPHYRRRARRRRDSPASESVSLVFAKVDLEYKPQKADFKYDIKPQESASALQVGLGQGLKALLAEQTAAAGVL